MAAMCNCLDFYLTEEDVSVFVEPASVRGDFGVHKMERTVESDVWQAMQFELKGSAISPYINSTGYVLFEFF
jgi:hypothetical protein